ncbi:MAG: hypothetical protein HQL64_10605 [Magnetococcales bacterium]|nr:hypothetical protein [Magnetococcales bacterium]
MRKMTKSLLVLAAALTGSTAHAADVYTFTATSGAQTGSVSRNDLESLVTTPIESLNIAGYTTSSAATAVMNLRGVTANSTYLANSSALQFSIPTLGISQTFNGATRSESQSMLKDWFKNNPDLLSKLFREYAKSTPIDPIAGNPNSLMSQMAATDFMSATGIGLNEKEIEQTGEAEKSGETGGTVTNPGLFGAEIRYGQFSSNGFKTTTTTLPLSYAKKIDKFTLLVDAPLTMIETESSKSYSGTLGIGLKTPIQKGWNITGYLRDGVGGSRDMGAISGVYSGSLISDFTYRVPDDGSKIMMGNMVSYMKTYAIEVGGYKTDYDLSNYVLRNGLAYERKLPTDIISKKVTGEVFAVNTYFGGDDVYINSSTDVGFALATDMTIGNYTYKDNKLGLTYTFGGGYTGFRVNYGYKF